MTQNNDLPDEFYIRKHPLHELFVIGKDKQGTKYHKSPPVVDVKTLKIKVHSWWLDNNNRFPNEIELMCEYIDHLIAEGIIQEKKT